MTDSVHQGDLTIWNASDAEAYKGVAEITGDLYISGAARLNAPALRSVGGVLLIYGGAKLDAPALKSVGGDLYISSEAKLDAPALKSIGGYLSIYGEAKLDVPALRSVGGDLFISGDTKLTAPQLYHDFSAFRVYDGVACVVLSRKRIGGVTVIACRHARIKNRKIIGDKFYIAQDGGTTAHGETIEEAIQELQFKLGPRDVSRFRNMPPDTRKTPSEWAFVYRMVTGACRFGTRHFMSQHKLKKSYTLAEIIDATRGQYGHEQFVRTVTGEA